MRVDRATVFAVSLGVTLALMLGIATATLAAVPGDPFRLGQINTINRISELVGSADSAMLRVENDGSGPALALRVNKGRPPLTVNPEGGKAPNLNSDELDGLDQSAFLRSNGKARDAFHADFADFAGDAQNAQVASNADTLDGKDSTDFLPGSLYTRQEYRDGAAGTVRSVTARCESGDLALSGGYFTTSQETTDTIYQFGRGDLGAGGTADSWELRWYDRAPATRYYLTVYCADTTP